jgi:type VI secretion system protein ImpH
VKPAVVSGGRKSPEERPVAAVSPSQGADAPRSPARERTLEDWLYQEPFAFDFFQAVRLLERLQLDRKAVGRGGPANQEVVRIRAHLSLAFPPSSIYDLEPGDEKIPVPRLTVSFLGLYGPSGMLPRHYTELLLKIDKEGKGAEKDSLRDWLDLFNHRFVSLFYRAWEKYRFYIPYERGDYAKSEPDPFTQALFSIVGLGFPSLRNRLRVADYAEIDGEPRTTVHAQIDDLALLYYGSYFAHEPRNAVSLERLLTDFFGLPVKVQQFQGQWLGLTPENQTQMGLGNCLLGENVVAGERVWDVQSKFRVQIGPLDAKSFTAFLPDATSTHERKAFFLLSHLVRLYAGPEFDFEVQLLLRAQEVPETRLAEGGIGPRLGWNTWIRSQDFQHDAQQAVFAGDGRAWLGAAPPALDENS